MSYNYQSAKLQTRKSKQPMPTATTSTDTQSSPRTKPQRPLTAYHIFFQIEREYIIQTTPGADADSSMHDHKSYQPDVPRRYSKIKLSNDWFAGPGKRAKRKHRKSHGKIGFLELSRVVSQRWADLAQIDPETKAFVGGIAKRELDQYKREMEEYEARVGSMGGHDAEAVAAVSKAKTTPAKKYTKRTAKKAAANALPMLPAVTESIISNFTYERSGTLITPPGTPPPSEFFPAEFDIHSVFVDVLPDAIFSETAISDADNIDYSISFMDPAGHHIPSPAGSVCEKKRSLSEESICDPLFELEMPDEVYGGNKRRRLSVDEADRLFDLWE